MISNHLAVFLIVGITWWPALFQFKAWAMAHKGKATSDIDFNPKDPPEVYNNMTIHNCLNEYTSMAREVHGPEYDPTT
jgi:hypothetical protein